MKDKVSNNHYSEKIARFFGICLGGGFIWELMAGFARHQLPYIPFSTAIPNNPIVYYPLIGCFICIMLVLKICAADRQGQSKERIDEY